MAEDDEDGMIENVMVEEDHDEHNEWSDDGNHQQQQQETAQLPYIDHSNRAEVEETLVCSRDDEKYDINAIVEHLIITGNYYRHQQWRVREWERNENRRNSPVDRLNEAAGMTTHKRRKRSSPDALPTNERTISSLTREMPATTSPTSSQPHFILHAQDARLYNPSNEKKMNEGMEPDLWPKTTYAMAKEAPLSDQRWDEELSDSIHPVEFSILRLSNVSPSSNDDPPPMEFSPQNHDTAALSHINSSACTARAMLLHCWERAVHAAATTLIVEPQQQPVPVTPNAATTATDTSNSNSNKRTRDEAIRLCQNLQIQECRPRQSLPSQDQQQSFGTATTKSMNDPTPTDHDDDIENYQCCHCHKEFTTKQRLHDHFYGTEHASQPDDCCSWMCIDAQRRTNTASILETEVMTLSQQLVRHILFHPDLKRLHTSSSSRNSNDHTHIPKFLDGFDVLQMIQEDLLTSRMISTAGSDRNLSAATSAHGTSDMDDNVVFETLEVSIDESPLPINAAVLEAVRFRLIDRYGKIPR